MPTAAIIGSGPIERISHQPVPLHRGPFPKASVWIRISDDRRVRQSRRE
jgi:hypothetical protein